MPTVSAIIPTYNRAEFVGGAVETALNQTYDDIEAVVVNDCSEDDTPAVLEEYADHDRVQVHHNAENQGIAYTFNRAAREADGEYLCILDDDDRWHPEKVEKQVALAESLPPTVGVIYTGGILVLDGRVSEHYRPSKRGRIYPEILARFGMKPHSGHMIRRAAFESVGGFDESFPRGTDWELAVRLAKNYRYEYVDEPLVRRVYHGGNISDQPEQETVTKLIREKYDEEFRQHPAVERYFQFRRARVQTQWALRRGDQRAALEHSVRGLRARPSPAAAFYVLLSVAGPRGFQVASRTRRRTRSLLTAARRAWSDAW